MTNIQSWLARNSSQMADDLEALCNINSGSDSIQGLEQVANWLVYYFEPLHCPVTRIDLPSFETVDDFGRIALHPTGQALRWNVSQSTAPTKTRVLLSIHYDTVYGPSSPFQNCYRYEAKNDQGVLEKRMRGPGVIDAKGGIVVLRWACLAAKRFLDLSKMDLSIVLTPDEEIGSPASQSLWQKIAGEFDFGMLFEPALPDGALVSQRKGTGTFVFVVHGKSAHAGRNFHDGRNAIAAACKLAVEVDQWNGQRPNVTINVGRIRGGDAVNVVPDLAVVRVNVRVSDREDQEWVETRVQQLVFAFQKDHPDYRIELHGGITSSPKTLTEDIQNWMKRVEDTGASLDQTIRWKTSGGASDGNKLAGLGLPNIDTFGPEGDLLHSDQEWVRLDSLPTKAMLTAMMLQASSHG